jgi:hypothetical protein
MAEPAPDANASNIGSKNGAMVKITTVYGIGKNIDIEPNRLIRKMPR